MTIFRQNINKYCIPAPKYNFGDVLEHTFHFADCEAVLVGCVIGRTYEEESAGVGYWEYWIKGNKELCSIVNFNEWCESLREDELKTYTSHIPVVHAIAA